jgi:hypothetical protein
MFMISPLPCFLFSLLWEHICYEEYLTFTFLFVQDGKTVLMIAAEERVSMAIMQFLLDSGATASINDTDEVVLLCSHPAVRL